jgi:cell division protein FtsW
MWRTASILVGVVLVLATFGIVMLASTSSVYGASQLGDPLYFVKRQLIYLMIALIAGLAVSRVDYRLWRTWAIPLGIGSFLLLCIVFLPVIGSPVKGSYRWIRLGPVNFQPSELAKLACVALVAAYIASTKRTMHTLSRGMFYPLGIAGLFLLPIFVSPDFGTTALMAGVVMCMLFAGGARISHLVVIAALGVVAFIYAVMQDEVRSRRIMAFLNPEEHALGAAFQLMNAIYAFVIGGWTGVGLGQSIQKRFYLPESHTDFIFAIIGEELGLVASLFVLLMFLVIFFCGLRISLRAPDSFGKLLALGITLMITMQAAFNIGVVTGSLPTKGLALPLVSYGGSSMVMTMIMIGVLVNIASKADVLGEG